MSNEDQDQGFRPPFLDPLSGITVTQPPEQGAGGRSWTPPPAVEQEESIEDILEMFRREAGPETGPEAADQSAPPEPGPPYASAPSAQGGPVPGPQGPEQPPAGAPFQAPWMGGGGAPPPPPAEGPYADAPPYAQPQFQAPSGAAAPQQIDPTTTAAVAAAMAAVLTDIGRTRYGYQAVHGQQPMMGGGYAGGVESMMASIMAEASRISSQPMGTQQKAEQSEVLDIVAEVHGWDAPERSEAPSESGPAGAPSVFTDPIQAEAARVQSRSAPENAGQQAGSAADPAVEATASFRPDPPGGGDAWSTNKPPSAPAADEDRPVRKSPKKRGKLKIAKDARAKGMRGGLDLSKTSVNVAVQVKTMSSPSRAIPLFLLVLAVIAAFGYFGVYQFINRVGQEESRLRALEQRREQMTVATVALPEVQKEYTLYGDTWMNEAELAQVDVMEVLSVVESQLLPWARVESVALTQNLLSVNLSGVTLEATAGIVDRLERLEIVKSVSVYTAATLAAQEVVSPPIEAEGPEAAAAGEAQNTNIAMTIVLQLPEAGEIPPGSEPVPTEHSGEGAAAS